MNTPACELCSGPQRTVLQVEGHAIHECETCLHRCLAQPRERDTHTREVFGDGYFFGGESGYPDYTLEAQGLQARGRWFADLMVGQGVAPGRLLDVGAAAGYLMRGMAERGFEPVGLEPSSTMAQRAREAGLDVRAGTLEDAEDLGVFDVVTLVQVVAHLTDLQLARERLTRLLSPGGHLLVETWNWRSTIARLLGQRWHEYSPPSVRHWFSPQSLDTWLSGAGLRRVGHGRPRKWVSWGHARSLLLREDKRASAPVRLAVKAADRVLRQDRELPYPSFDLFWSLYRREG